VEAPEASHSRSAHFRSLASGPVCKGVRLLGATSPTERSSSPVPWRNDLPDRGYEPDNRMKYPWGHWPPTPVTPLRTRHRGTDYSSQLPLRYFPVWGPRLESRMGSVCAAGDARGASVALRGGHANCDV
jgi:hypothetical protein